MDYFTDLCSRLLVTLLPHLLSLDHVDTPVAHSHSLEGASEDDEEEEEATEQTRLIAGGRKRTPAARLIRQTALNVELLAGLVGLLVGLLRPLQRVLIGTSESATGGWSGIGGGLLLLGGAYATVDMLSIGASVRAGEKK